MSTPMKSSVSIYIGLMSGTSIDGIDGVLAQFSATGQPTIITSTSIALPESLRHELLALNQSGPDELVRAARAANSLAAHYAAACRHLLENTHLETNDINAIGAHGQTVRHNPGAGYTLQLNAPALLAELSGLNVIADFRTRDVAAGGQGAPLVPAFHATVFSHHKPRIVLNLGGMANISVLDPGEPVRGFDTGPANVLLDLWCERHTGQAYDKNGEWAASGTSCTGLLHHLMHSEPWFAAPPPKSTGRDLFNAAWLDERLRAWQSSHPAAKLDPADIQATLVELTAQSVADAIRQEAPDSEDILVCGGGAFNAGLMQALAKATGLPVVTTDAAGVPVQMVEALAFAWLAWAYDNNHPAGLPSVTGARKPTILGCLYKA
ncbi:MAG: anhydro-N-acetylmuramic acid kinase [Alcaligenaceae bacterium]|nr:anhydro-N-acetylmuramic acid kinase [Alcaligenaceae bacterium]